MSYIFDVMVVYLLFLMIRLPPRSTRTDTLFPYTTLFRSKTQRRVAFLCAFARDYHGAFGAAQLDVGVSSAQHRPMTAFDDWRARSPFYDETHEALAQSVRRFVAREIAPHIDRWERSEEHTSELQSLMRISYAVFCLKKKKENQT